MVVYVNEMFHKLRPNEDLARLLHVILKILSLKYIKNQVIFLVTS